jgi:hypothetical protein
MKRLTAAVTATLMTIAGTVAVAPAARAGTEHAPPWRWATVTNPRTDVPIGTQHDVTLNCPSGYRPVSWIWGSSYDNTTSTLTLQAETMDYANNSALLRVYNNTGHDDAVDATLNCVNGADIGTVTTVTTTVAHVLGNAGGFQACPFASTLLGGSAIWDVNSPQSRIDFVAPTSNGWYVTGNTVPYVTHNLTISAHCIGASASSGVHIAQTTSTADPDAQGLVTATAICNAGERVATAGAYEHADGSSIDATKTLGSIRTISQFSSKPLTSSASVKATEPNTTTTLVVFAICLLYSTPVVTITEGPSGQLTTSDIAFTFTATDPAGYQLTFACEIYRLDDNSHFYQPYASAPCVPGTSNAVTGLPDGAYFLSVNATNGDYRTGSAASYFSIDATGPVVAVSGKPDNPTTSTSASFTVTATDVHPGTTYCHLDSESEHSCPSPAAYSGLADGVHTFQWLAVDSLGNQTTGSYSWRVDTIAPTASVTAPTAPFTMSTATVKWTGADAGSGVANWQVQWQRAPYNGGFGAWSSPATFAAGTLSHTYTGLARGYDYCYRVRSVDRAGNSSAYSTSRCIAVVLDERSLTVSSGWTINTSSAYYGGSAVSSKHVNATLKRTGAQLDRLALLATKCPTCGSVGLYVSGELIGKVSLHATTLRNQQLIKLPVFSYRTGTVTIKVLSSGKLVRIDGLGISRT